MPKILDPLPAIANTNQLLRLFLRDQIVTLCYQFFLHMSHIPATDPYQQIVLTPYCENLPSPVTMGMPLISAVAIISLRILPELRVIDGDIPFDGNLLPIA